MEFVRIRIGLLRRLKLPDGIGTQLVEGLIIHSSLV